MHLPTWLSRHNSKKILLGTRGLFGLSSVSIPLVDYNTHLYVVGASGSGKSKLLQHLLFELITKGWGCGVIDPHSDLVSDLLAQLHETGWLSQPQNFQRTIFLDPARSDYLIPANILRCSYATPYETAEHIIEAFRRVWPETLAEAPRFAQIMRNALIVLAENNLTLAELEPLLTQYDLRKRLLANTSDQEVVSFFTDQYNRWGREQVIMAGPVLNKVAAFLFQPSVRYSLGAAENCLDLRTIIDRGNILLVDLGGLNGETQQLYGSLLVTSLEQAATSRRNQEHTKRRPFFCMIDEFPFFCARDPTTLAHILSEVRKYRCLLGLAHQSLSQTNQQMQGALENAMLKCAFGTGRDTAAALAAQMFLPNPYLIKHEVSDPTAQGRSHPLYETLYNQLEMGIQQLMRLKKRDMLVKLPDCDTIMKLRTPRVCPMQMNSDQLAAVKTALVQRVGKSPDLLINQRDQRLQRTSAALHNRPELKQDSAWKEALWHPTTTRSSRPWTTVAYHGNESVYKTA